VGILEYQVFQGLELVVTQDQEHLVIQVIRDILVQEFRGLVDIVDILVRVLLELVALHLHGSFQDKGSKC